MFGAILPSRRFLRCRKAFRAKTDPESEINTGGFRTRP